MRLFPLFLMLAASCEFACSPFAAGVASGVAGPRVPTAPAGSSARLMIFGGEGHRTYLGCLNCSEYASDSVLNRYGPHGSPYATDSIFNRYGTYGSPYSTSSPCSPYGGDPPVIVDEGGNSYGRLTVNVYATERTKLGYWSAWIAGVCQHQ